MIVSIVRVAVSRKPQATGLSWIAGIWLVSSGKGTSSIGDGSDVYVLTGCFCSAGFFPFQSQKPNPKIEKISKIISPLTIIFLKGKEAEDEAGGMGEMGGVD